MALAKLWREMRPTTKAARLWLDHLDSWTAARAEGAFEAGERLSDQINRWALFHGPLPDDDALISALNAGGPILPMWACVAAGLISEGQEHPVAWSLQVFRRSKASPRGWMMRLFHGPEEARDALVDEGLNDKSKRVREWACEGTEYSNDRKKWLPRLALLAKNDSAEDVRAAALHSFGIIEKGYLVSFKNGSWDFLVEDRVGRAYP